jgi:DNA polymerase phi
LKADPYRQEDRDHHFGRLFGIEAILKSGILLSSTNLQQYWQRVLEITFGLGRLKPWLREQCTFVVSQSIPLLKNVDGGDTYAAASVDTIYSNGLLRTADGIAIVFAVKETFPEVKINEAVWAGDPLRPANIKLLKEVLLESSSNSDEEFDVAQVAAQRGSWSHNAHFVWNHILRILSQNELATNGLSNGQAHNAISFEEFWQAVVDGGLFAENASDERRFWGLSILNLAMTQCPPSLIPVMLSSAVCTTLQYQLHDRTRNLYSSAHVTLNAIARRASDDPPAATALAKTLLSRAQFTVSNPLMQILQSTITLASQDSARAIFEQYFEVINRPGKDETEADTKRIFLMDRLLSYLRSTKVKNHKKAAFDILDFLTKHAFFDPRKHGPKPAISPKARAAFKARLFSCLTEIAQTKQDFNQEFAVHVIKEIQKLDGKDKFVMNVSVSEKVKNRALDLIKAVSEKEDSVDKRYKQAYEDFKTLCTVSVLQVFNNAPETKQLVSDLRDCLKLMTAKEQNTDVEQRIGNHIATISLEFLSNPSALFRKVGQVVFMKFASFMGPDSLRPFYLVVAEEYLETETGQDLVLGLANIGSESEEEEEEDDSDAGDSDNEDDEDDDDAEESEDSDEDGKLEADEKLNEALGSLLQSSTIDVKMGDAADTNGDGDESDSDASMTSSQMEGLDDKLAAVFKEQAKRPEQKKIRKALREAAQAHKLRCIEVLTSFMKANHARAVTLSMLLPMCGTLRFCPDEKIRQKAYALVKDYSMIIKNNKHYDGFVATDAWRIFYALHAAAAAGSPHKASWKSYSLACLVVAKALIVDEREAMETIIDTYSTNLKTYMQDPGCSYHSSWFGDFQIWLMGQRASYLGAVSKDPLLVNGFGVIKAGKKRKLNEMENDEEGSDGEGEVNGTGSNDDDDSDDSEADGSGESDDEDESSSEDAKAEDGFISIK